MVRMFSVPSPAASTCRRNTKPMASASSATTATTTTSVTLPPERFTSCPTAAARVVPGIRPPRRLRARRCTGGSRASGRDDVIWPTGSRRRPMKPRAVYGPSRGTQSRPGVTFCTVADATRTAQPLGQRGPPAGQPRRAAPPRPVTPGRPANMGREPRSAGPGHPDDPAGSAGPRLHGHGVGEAAHQGQRDRLLLALAEACAVGHHDVQARPLVVQLDEDVPGGARLEGAPDRAGAHLADGETDLVEPDLVHPGTAGYGHGDEPRGADVLRCGLEPQRDGHELRSPDLGGGAQLAVPSGTPLVSSSASASVGKIGKTLVRPVIRKTLRIFSCEHTRLSVPS